MRWVFALVMLCAACGGEDGGEPPGGDGGSATLSDCGDTPSMDLGRCEVTSGDDCTGADGEVNHFVPLSSGDSMRMVVGPQGSTMLVFMARAEGIDPGDPATPRDSGNPLVQVALLDASSGDQLTFYRSRMGFEESGGQYVSGQLWVVVDALASSLDGRSLVALAEVRDSAGAERCARVRVVARR